MAQMKPKSLAVFNSNDIYPISADSTMPFQQSRDIFYLSGVDQEESKLVLFPDAPKPEHREILFLKETTVYFNTNEHYRANVETETREARFVKWCKDRFPAHQVAKSNPILQRLRSVKDPIELDLIQKACNITEKGFRRVLKFVKPGVMEYNIEAELMHEFLNNRSRGFAYTPIIASGNNANVLHYI